MLFPAVIPTVVSIVVHYINFVISSQLASMNQPLFAFQLFFVHTIEHVLLAGMTLLSSSNVMQTFGTRSGVKLVVHQLALLPRLRKLPKIDLNMRCADLRDINYTLEEERWLKLLHHIIPEISRVRLRRSTKSLKGRYVFLQLMVCLVTCLSLIFGLLSYMTFSAPKMSLNETTSMLML